MSRGVEQSRFYTFGKSRRSRRIKERRRRRILVATVAAFFALLSVIFLASTLSKISGLKIGEIKVSGVKILPAGDVENSVAEILSGNHLGLFSRRNIFLYPKREIEKALADEYPAIVKVSVELGSDNALLIKISERVPRALSCPTNSSGFGTTSVALPVQPICYYIDENGLIFSESAFYSEGVYVIYKGFEKGATTPLRTQLLPEKEFEALSRFTDSLRADNLKPDSVTARENYFEIGLNDKTTILISGDTADYDIALSNLEASMRQPDILNAFSGKPPLLDYIDLRSDDKVYYKFRE